MKILVCVLVSMFLCLSYARASSWNPEDALKEFLTDNYPWDEIEIYNVNVLGKLPNDPPEAILVEKGPTGGAVFSFIFKDNHRTPVNAYVRALGRVVKSKRSFRKGHVIREDDIYMAKMDVNKIPGSSVKDPSDILGKSLRRSIIANIPIAEDMLEMSQVVAKGKTVVLLVNQNGMSIRAAGKIMEKGYVGSPVRAVNLSTKKEVSGVLIDENTLKVTL